MAKKIKTKSAYDVNRIPPSKHSLGYKDTELRKILTKPEYIQFNKWIRGQTCGLHPKTYEHLYYTWDVLRFIDIVRHGGVDVWD